MNLAGAVPFVMKGNASGPRSYHLALIVRADSPYQKPADLKGKKVAHVSPSSNSGNLAPRALFPAQGLVPDTDYKPLYSGKHDQSILGVNSGDYDAAAVADDVLERMAKRGVVKMENFRKLYVSPPFVTSSFAHAHDLEPETGRGPAELALEHAREDVTGEPLLVDGGATGPRKGAAAQDVSSRGPRSPIVNPVRIVKSLGLCAVIIPTLPVVSSVETKADKVHGIVVSRSRRVNETRSY